MEAPQKYAALPYPREEPQHAQHLQHRSPDPQGLPSQTI